MLRRRELVTGAAALAAFSQMSRVNALSGPKLLTRFPGNPPYLLHEKFARYPNNTVLNGKFPLVGPVWGTTGGSIPTTTGGKLTNTGLGYLYANLGTTPQVIGCKVTFSGGTDMTQLPMAMALSSQTPGALQIVNLVHYNFGPTGFVYGVFDNTGTFKSILAQSWVKPMKNDGTVYETYIGVIGDNVVITGPNGEKFSISDPHTAPAYGPLVFWEPITEGDGLSCQVVELYAIDNKTSIFGPTTFNPNDKTSAITLSNGLLTATCNSTGGPSPQVRSIAGRSYGNTHFEFTINSNAAASRDGLGFASLLSHNFTTNLGDDFASWAIYPFFDSIFMNLGGSFTEISSGWTWPVGAVGAVEINWLTMFAWIKQASPVLSGWNNDVLANQNPATGTGGINLNAVNTGWPMALAAQIAGLNDSITLNAGASPWAVTPSAGFVSFLE